MYLWHVFSGTVKHLKLVNNFIFFASDLSSWVRCDPFGLKCKLCLEKKHCICVYYIILLSLH